MMEPIRKASTIMGGLIIAAFACRGSWIACSYRMPDIFHLRISEPWLPHASNRRMTGSLATQCHSHTNELFKALSEALTSSTGQFELELWIVALPRVQWGAPTETSFTLGGLIFFTLELSTAVSLFQSSYLRIDTLTNCHHLGPVQFMSTKNRIISCNLSSEVCLHTNKAYRCHRDIPPFSLEYITTPKQSICESSQATAVAILLRNSRNFALFFFRILIVYQPLLFHSAINLLPLMSDYIRDRNQYTRDYSPLPRSVSVIDVRCFANIIAATNKPTTPIPA